MRVPFADGTLVVTSDVMGTGWFAAATANVKPGKTVAVIDDGAVGFLGVCPPNKWVRNGLSR